MNRQPSNPSTSPPNDTAAMEQARSFLSALFLGLRTAQTHEFSRRIFENATRIVLRSANQLYVSTGGFTIQFGESMALFNGQPLQFEGGSDSTLASLKHLLESAGMRGLDVRTPPTEAQMRKLLLLFSPANPRKLNRDEVARAHGDLEKHEPTAHAIRLYAKLLLALRGEPLKLQRIFQDLVDLVIERPNYLLKLAMNEGGGTEAELHSVNSALVALVLGRALGLLREDLVHLASAALLHHAGPTANRRDAAGELGEVEANASVTLLASTNPVGRTMQLRIAVIGERCEVMPAEANQDPPTKKPHLFSRILSVAVRYQQLVGGFGTADARSLTPLLAIERLSKEETSGLDPRLVDLLINVLRVFPVGTEVILDTGETALVSTISNHWDRPTVRVDGIDGQPRTVNLAEDQDPSIIGTRRFLGTGDRITLDEPIAPPLFDNAQLLELGVAEVLSRDVTVREQPPPLNRRVTAPVNPQTSAPVNRQTFTPVNRQTSAPVNRQTSAPVNRQTSAPVNRQTSAPVNRQASAPVNRQASSPVNRQASSPVNREASTPVNREASSPVNREANEPEIAEISPSEVELIPMPLDVHEAHPPLMNMSDEITVVEDQAISEIGELKERLERRRKREAERHRARRNSKLEHLSAQIAGYRAERNELEDEANALDADATAAERLSETVVLRQADIDRTLSDLTPTIAELEKSLDALWSKQQQLSNQANELETRATAARADALDVENKATEAEAAAKENAARTAELEAALKQLRIEREELDRTAHTFRHAAEEENRIAAEAETRVEALRREAQAVVSDLSGNEEKLDAMRERRTRLDAEKLALEKSSANAKLIAAETRARVNEARERIAESDQTIAELERELDTLRSS